MSAKANEIPTVGGRVYANGKMGVFLRIKGDGDPSSLVFDCVVNHGTTVKECSCYADAVEFADAYIPPETIPRKIAGKTLDEWHDYARRDDCLDNMAPSDLRILISEIL